MQDVIKFIKNFHGAEETFLNGCCYWFAKILKDRFDGLKYYVDIYHEPIEGHFIAGFRQPVIDSPKPYGDVCYFDIRGDVTHLYYDKELEDMWEMMRGDQKRYVKLMCDCRDFIDPDNYPEFLSLNL